MFCTKNSMNKQILIEGLYFRSEFNEPMDLQLDYWVMSSKDEKESGSSIVSLGGLGSIGDSSQKPEFRKSAPASGYGDGGAKSSIKTSIWRMQIQRLGVQSVSDQPAFSMQYWLKEKKSKGTLICTRNNGYILV